MVGDRTWYHTIDLPDGTATPGYFDTRDVPASVDWPAVLAGGRVLDVGTFDGFWAFEMERRGAAEVLALDLDDPARLDWFYDDEVSGAAVVRTWGASRGPGFRTAHEQLGSRVTRVDRSVYDLDADELGRFDVVFCGALLLHLRDPVRALEAMRSVCAGSLVLVETIDPTLELRARRLPAARFHPAWDQWWRVNTAGLAAMVDAAGFGVDWSSEPILVPPGTGFAGPSPSRLNALLARRPRARGVLHRAMRATPRARRPNR